MAACDDSGGGDSQNSSGGGGSTNTGGGGSTNTGGGGSANTGGGGSENTGGGGSENVGGSSGTTSQSGSENQADHDTLAACGASPCEEGTISALEGSVDGISKMLCIVEAMRDRTSGVYSLKVDHDHTVGSDKGSATIFVTPAGEAEVALYRNYDALLNGGATLHVEEWVPTRRCVLKPVSFFEGCLDGVSVGGGSGFENGWDTQACILEESELDSMELPWFESCEDLAPTCQ